MGFKPEPITLNGTNYWGLRFCKPKGSGVPAKTILQKLIRGGKAYFVSHKNPKGIVKGATDIRVVLHKETGKVFYMFKIKAGTPGLKVTRRYPTFVKTNKFSLPYDSITGKDSAGAYVVIPNQGFGNSQRACRYSSYNGQIAADIKKVRVAYQRVLALFDVAIKRRKVRPEIKKKFITRFGDFDKVSAPMRKAYFQIFQKLLKRTMRKGSAVKIRPKAGICKSTLTPAKIREGKQYIILSIKMLQVLSSPPFYPSPVVTRKKYQSYQKTIATMKKILGCDKNIQKVGIKTLKGLTLKIWKQIEIVWSHILLNRSIKARRLTPVQKDLRKKAKYIIDALREMKKLYAIVKQNKFPIPFPPKLKHLTGYITSPYQFIKKRPTGLEPRYKRLIRLRASTVKSSAEGYVKRFDIKVRTRLVYALTRLAKRKLGGSKGPQSKIALRFSIHYYEKLIKKPNMLLQIPKGNTSLSSFFRWAKKEARKIKAF